MLWIGDRVKTRKLWNLVEVKKMSSQVETEQARINEERDLHELFRIWEQRYTTPNYDPEPIVRR